MHRDTCKLQTCDNMKSDSEFTMEQDSSDEDDASDEEQCTGTYSKEIKGLQLSQLTYKYSKELERLLMVLLEIRQKQIM